VKSICQKLIKIDIMLSHVKLYKMSVLTRSSEQKNFQKKTWQKKSGKWLPRRQNRPESGKPKTDLLDNRPTVGFRFIENRSVLVLVSDSRRALPSIM
jgi:hypothetical protein